MVAITHRHRVKRRNKAEMLAITHGLIRRKGIKNKGQMKIQQMAFMLIAVTLFFSLVGMFFLVIFVSNLRESASILEEKNALLLVIKLANSPEFSCGESFGPGKLNCIDGDKVMMLKKNIDRYNDFWGVDNIEIRKIYPVSEDVECTTVNYPNCNIIKIRGGNLSFEYSNFVVLCRKENVEGIIENKCDLAKIMVSYG